MAPHKPYPSLQTGIEHHKAGRIAQARAVYSSVLQTSPGNSQALYLLGVLAEQAGEHEKAVGLFTQASHANPSQASFHLQRGLSLSRMESLDEAASAYRAALALNPGYVDAHCNLGNVLARSDIDAAIASYRRALELAPDAAQIHYNLGVLFQGQFQPERAVECFRNAILHRPDYAYAYNNLGVSLSDTGHLDDAMACYRKAQQLDPDFADPFYNLHALLLDRNDQAAAIDCLEKAARIQPENGLYQLSLSMLHEYGGDSQNAARYLASMADDATSKADLDAWNYLKTAGSALPPLLGSAANVFRFSMDRAAVEGLVLEFGVFHGKSIRLIASMVTTRVHGFDSFQGIPEDWNHELKGSYSTRGVVPDVPENVVLHDGWFDDSIPPFIEKESGPIRFMNIDCDLYSSTKTVLELLSSQIVNGTVIVFDEYIGNASWRDDEFKAFNEAAAQYGWAWEILCFSFVTKQVAIRIIATPPSRSALAT